MLNIHTGTVEFHISNIVLLNFDQNKDFWVLTNMHFYYIRDSHISDIFTLAIFFTVYNK